jgi:hypothetical protein
VADAPIRGASRADEVPDGDRRIFAIFTGNVEGDPHRVGLWTVEITTEGLALERADCVEGEQETGRVSWDELHSMLGHRIALGDDIESLRDEIESHERTLVRLRTESRRLRTLVDARKQTVNGGSPREAPGIIALRPLAATPLPGDAR